MFEYWYYRYQRPIPREEKKDKKITKEEVNRIIPSCSALMALNCFFGIWLVFVLGGLGGVVFERKACGFGLAVQLSLFFQQKSPKKEKPSGNKVRPIGDEASKKAE